MPANLRHLPRACAVLVLLGTSGFARAADLTVPTADKAPAAAIDEQVRAFLAKHCQECHRGAKPKGEFDLDQLVVDFADKAGRERWLDVRKQLQSGQMPPDSQPRPPEEDIKAVADWITRQAVAAETVEQATQGRVVLRRLNRVEYENTIHDLLGVNLELKELLALDGSTAGFDNVGSGLHISSFALARYLEAGDQALSAAIANTPRPPRPIKKHESLKDAHYPINSTKEPAYRKLDDGTVVCFCSSEWLQVHFPFWPEEQGLYRFRLSASAFQSSGKPIVFSIMSGGGGKRRAQAHLIGYYDAPADEPAVFEFVDRVEPHTSTTVRPYGLPHAKAVEDQGGVETYSGPGLAIQWLEVEGPLYETWPPPSHRRIFGDLPQATVDRGRECVEVVSEAPLADAERILLGQPPPPPPPDVPSLEPDIRGAVTIRQKLAKHRELTACAACHAQIDPLGFALESFDCIGGWRENYRTTGLGQLVEIDGRRMPYLRGPEVDAGDVLADGERFRDIDELKQLLLKNKDQIVRALTEKLVTYATGAARQTSDQAEIESIVSRVRDKGYGLRSLIHEIVASKLFLDK